jgi:hypothetical protein
MMTRPIVASLIVALVCVTFEDVQMTTEDLAFFLAMHNYDATPKEGFVQVKMYGTIYNLVPNGAAPGLADLTLLN